MGESPINDQNNEAVWRGKPENVSLKKHCGCTMLDALVKIDEIEHNMTGLNKNDPRMGLTKRWYNQQK